MPETHIQDVWASNFHEEMKKLMKLAERFNVIAMVLLLPGRIRSSPASSPRAANLTNATIQNNSVSTSW
jgi:hypothetical protein